MSNLTKIAALPMAGGAMAALPAEKSATDEQKITDHHEAAKLAAKLVGEAIIEAIEAHKTAMREMVRTMADEVVRQVIAQIPKDEDADGLACGGYDASDAATSAALSYRGHPMIPFATPEEAKAMADNSLRRTWGEPCRANFSGTPEAIKVADVYLSTDPAPWDATHESFEYTGGDGRMYKHKGRPKTFPPLWMSIIEERGKVRATFADEASWALVGKFIHAAEGKQGRKILRELWMSPGAYALIVDKADAYLLDWGGK